MVVHPSTRKHGVKLAIWTATNVGRPILVGHLTAAGNIARAASPFVAAGVAGYALGAVFGVGLSNAFFGESGRVAAIDLYSSPTKFWDKAIMGAGENVDTIISHYF